MYRNSCGIFFEKSNKRIKLLSACAIPKKTAAPSAPNGCHLPKIIAAMAINPCPEIVLCENALVVVNVMVAPPRPPNRPLISTAR
ncbi:hypothetical protein D3C85_1516180 [compost metagenome]